MAKLIKKEVSYVVRKKNTITLKNGKDLNWVDVSPNFSIRKEAKERADLMRKHFTNEKYRIVKIVKTYRVLTRKEEE
ncbi:MAG: hypothetical protein HRT98_04430 [Mycoplasmatales bacterium]|nr:hypothetical protein [Mycoplasmatales bacterium]